MMCWKIIIAAMALSFLSFHGGLNARTWTSKGGSKTFEAELTAYNSKTQKVKVKMADGRTMSFAQNILSAEDIAFVVRASKDLRKPLKVYILSGQSNMEGHAQTRTFPAVGHDLKTADIHKAMVDSEGKPVVCDQVWISFAYGDFSGNMTGTKSGALTAGFGSQHHIGTGKIGPEFTFGIYMQRYLDEPILLIKTAWGGRSLYKDFRPPSAGELPDPDAKHAKEDVGKFYKLMIEHVKSVLADPKTVCPSYDPKAGFELAGFVWFQGFNDMVGPYPRVDPAKGKKSSKDYSDYSRLLSCLIRDVRKDLAAPNLPFVIGVLGVDGKTANAGNLAFRASMAAPAETEEFKGNVVNVFSENYWPTELDELFKKTSSIKNKYKRKSKELSSQNLDSAEKKKANEFLQAEMRAEFEKILTADELFLLDNGSSNAGYHYHGSAKFFGQLGKAFADALLELN